MQFVRLFLRFTMYLLYIEYTREEQRQQRNQKIEKLAESNFKGVWVHRNIWLMKKREINEYECIKKRRKQNGGP